MADTATPNVIRRADYAPPAFLIDTVALEFDLVPERTVVRNTMRVRRNPDASHAANLELMGEQLEFVSAMIDGAPFAHAHAHEHGLTLDNVPDNFELRLPASAIRRKTPRCRACMCRAATSSRSARPRAFAASLTSSTAPT
jgi:Aminopeptidase N